MIEINWSFSHGSGIGIPACELNTCLVCISISLQSAVVHVCKCIHVYKYIDGSENHNALGCEQPVR